jgi:hypothetical protein
MVALCLLLPVVPMVMVIMGCGVGVYMWLTPPSMHTRRMGESYDKALGASTSAQPSGEEGGTVPDGPTIIEVVNFS